jgi:predicted MFS family arabinose efflux permease
MSSLPNLVLIVSSGLAVWWRLRYETSQRALNLPGVGFRMVFLLPALTPFMPEPLQIPWLILSVTLPAVPQGIAGAVFLTLMRESVSTDKMTKLTSRRQVGLNAGVAVGALGFGILLESLPFPLNYQLMFVIAFVFALMSHWHVLRVKILYPSQMEKTQPAPRVRMPALKRGDGTALWKNPTFRVVLMCVFLLHLAFFATVAIVPLHLVQNLHASEAFIAAFGMVELLSGMLIATQTDKLARFIGERGLMSAGMMGTALAAATIAIAPRAELTLISAAISGASWTAAVVGLYSFFYAKTPPEHITRASIVQQQLAGLGLFIGPLIGSTLVNHGVTLVTAILVGAGVRLVAGVLVMDYRTRRRTVAAEEAREALEEA